MMDERGLDILLATVPENVFYVTDLPCSSVSPNRLLNCVRNSSPAFAIVDKTGEVTLVVTSAAVELAKETSWVKDIKSYATGTYIVRPRNLVPSELGTDPLEVVSRIISATGAKKVGLDQE